MNSCGFSRLRILFLETCLSYWVCFKLLCSNYVACDAYGHIVTGHGTLDNRGIVSFQLQTFDGKPVDTTVRSKLYLDKSHTPNVPS
jgi:hypothetical protein